MTSLLRFTATPVRTASKFTNISTPSYSESSLGENVPIPFTITSQTLDINTAQGNVSTFISNGNSPNDDSFYQAKLMGGMKLITEIGPNLETYLRNLIQNIDSLGSPYAGTLTLYVKPTMTKVQIAQPNQVQALEFEAVYGVNQYPPTSDDFVGGQFSDNYYASWVFYSPMTIQFSSSASVTGYKYITFTTHYDGN